MAEITIEECPKNVRDLYNKAFTAFERGNQDYAIDLFLQTLKLEPRLLAARKYLRSAEIQKFKQQKKKGFFAKAFGASAMNPKYILAQRLLKPEKAMEALDAAETLLRDNPLDPNYAKLFARAAILADLPEAGIQLLELIRDANPEDVSLFNMLGQLYLKVGRTRSARECFERICELMPNDPDALKQLKDALAIDTMDTGGWSQATSYRDIIKDTKEALILEQESKAVKTDEDIDALITETLKKIEKEPGNINYYRHLAKMYSQVKAFDKASDAIIKAQEMSPGDPELDATLTSIKSQQFDRDIALLEQAGNAQAIEQKQFEKAQFLFDDMQDRVQRYPNDLRLKFDWGVMLYENDYINEAIQQFQASQRSPKHRTLSLYYLAMCFKAKKQLDLAAEQLHKAGEELYTMDETKKDIIYQLGMIAEEMGNKEKASEYFKQIYSVDIKYKDVAEKVENVYSGI